jgi:uncharacterized membrane protein YqjE
MTTREPYPIEQPEKTLGDLVSDLTTEFSALVEDHVDLAKAEIRQDIRDASKAGGMFGGAGVSALLALLLLSMAAAWGLAEVIEPGWAFLVVGGLWAVVAAVLALSGRKQVERMEPGPRRTMEEIQEDRRWLTTKTN